MDGARNLSLGTKDPPLVILVEQYLADNSNLSYINIDDMIDHLRSKYFRFQRMQRKVFGNQVRSAYFDYCKRNNSNGKPKEQNGAQTQDVELLEDKSPAELNKNIANASLTALYKAQNNAREKSLGNQSNVSSNGGSEPQNFVAGMPIVAVATTTVYEDSDDDLEIIDEVQGVKKIQCPIPSGSREETVSKPFPSGLSVSFVKDNLETLPQPNIAISPSKIFSSEAVHQAQVEALSQSSSKNEVRPNLINKIASQSSVGVVSTTNFNNSNRSKTVDPPTRERSATYVSSRGVKRKTSPLRDGNELEIHKKLKKEFQVVQDSGYRLSDFAGSEKVVEEVCRLLMHLKHPEVYKTLGVTAPRGFLLHGPPGTGKTLLANAIAGELQIPMLKIAGTEFVSGVSGESESNIRDLFNQALTLAPCFIFIDEIDSITPKRENVNREMERRIVTQLLSCVDDLMHQEKGNQVLLIGATNRIESIDNSLRRAGRFDKEICLGIPDEKSRHKILKVICRNLRLAPGLDLRVLAKLTPGYVGADLQMLVREAAVQAVNKALLGGKSSEEAEKIDSNDNLKESNITDKEQVSFLELDKPVIVSVFSTANNPPDDDDKVIEIVEMDTSQQNSITLEQTNKEGTSQESHLEVNNQETTVKEKEGDGDDTNIETVMELDKSLEEGAASISEEFSVNMPQITSVEGGVGVEKQGENSGTGVESVEDPESFLTPGITIVEEFETAQNGEEEILKSESTNLSSEDQQEPGPSEYLRWIKESAPLTVAELDDLYIFMDDFEVALKQVQPSSKREGFATVPDTTWDDIGALASIREELEISILGPVKHSRAFEALGLNCPAGVLLCGPPGCGKTLLAKAVANEAGINFISVKGPELLNMYVGESERAVRQCFLRAKNSSPCVIFFDEIDALCPRRSNAPDNASGGRIVNQLLTEMDGIEGRLGVFVMAATNRPDILDPAILRPGRLDKILFVDLPSAIDRCEILKAITKNGTKPLLCSDVDLRLIAERDYCEFYTGADLAALVREASIAAFKELILSKSDASIKAGDLNVAMRHFEAAFVKTKPSVTKKDRDRYAEMKERYSNVSGR